ncbi:MAG: hypothetical protein ACRES7_10200 [Gammaproteobacteria bacterium]
MRARLARVASLIEMKGLEHVRAPHVKHVEGPLWEIRLSGRSVFRARCMSPPVVSGS